MIKTVTVTNYVGDSLILDMANPYKNGFAILNIDGIASLDATINTTDVATNDGAVYNSARVNTRNIVFTVKPLWITDQSIEEGRLLIYKYFPVKKRLTLRFKTDTRDVQIAGYVESSATEVFAELEQAQISIICPNPYFEDANPQTVSFSGVNPLFEFPFGGEGFIRRDRLEEFLETRNVPDNLKVTNRTDYRAYTVSQWNAQIAAERNYTSVTHNSIARGLGNKNTFNSYFGISNESKITWTDYTFDWIDKVVWNLYQNIKMTDPNDIARLTGIPVATVQTFLNNHGSANFDAAETSETGILEFSMSEIFNTPVRTIYYTGDIETGMTMTIHMIGTVRDIVLYNRSTTEMMSIVGEFQNKDDIIIGTHRNYKSAKLLRNGEYSNILNMLDKNSDWFELQKGSNVIAYVAREGDDKMQLQIQTRVLYEGI